MPLKNMLKSWENYLSTLGFSPSRRVLSLMFHEPSLPWPRSKGIDFPFIIWYFQ